MSQLSLILIAIFILSNPATTLAPLGPMLAVFVVGVAVFSMLILLHAIFEKFHH